jgi:hypothetical protein
MNLLIFMAFMTTIIQSSTLDGKNAPAGWLANG